MASWKWLGGAYTLVSVWGQASDSWEAHTLASLLSFMLPHRDWLSDDGQRACLLGYLIAPVLVNTRLEASTLWHLSHGVLFLKDLPALRAALVSP